MKILRILLSFAFALALSVIGAGIIAPLISVDPLFVAGVILAANFIPGSQGCFYLLAFAAPGGVGTPFFANLPYLPEVLHWNDAGNPITALRVQSDKDGILYDLNAAGIAAMRGYRQYGPLTANDQNVMLASGHSIRNITITGTTAAVGVINFYTHSNNKATDKKPVVPFRAQADTATALTPTTFQNFAALFIPTMATLTDYADIEYEDGHVQRWEIQDLICESTRFQEVPGIIIDNLDAIIHRATIRCAAATPVYSLRYYIKGQ